MKTRELLSICAAALLAGCATPAALVTQPAPDNSAPAAAATEAFSEDVTRRTFQYFWDTTDAQRCLAPDRWPTRTFSSIAATGFAITAYGVGAERGYVSRAEAAKRTREGVLLSLSQI